MEIDIWDLKSIDKAIRKLQKEKPLLDKRTESFVTKLGELGRETATNEYAEALIAGPNDIKVKLDVSPIENGHKATVEAGGTAVLFTEFGTGITKQDAPDARGELENTDGLFAHGQYGRHHGSNPKGWNFRWKPSSTDKIPPDTYYMERKSRELKKDITHTLGQDVTPAMYHAKKKMEKNIKSVARRVFR